MPNRAALARSVAPLKLLPILLNVLTADEAAPNVAPAAEIDDNTLILNFLLVTYLVDFLMCVVYNKRSGDRINDSESKLPKQQGYVVGNT